VRPGCDEPDAGSQTWLDQTGSQPYTRLMQTCENCGEESPEGARFCFSCGSPLADGARRSHEARKVVTILFADVAESTALGEQLDSELLRRVLSRYFQTVSQVLERHGGTVEKFIGDAVMAVFGIPAVHEDDALRAVRAAVEMRDAVEALNDELKAERGVSIHLRTGINTGEVVAGDAAAGQTLVTGDAVNVAARLEQGAGAGEIVLGEATRRLVRDAVCVEPLGTLALKGKTDGVLSWRLVKLLSDAPSFARHFDSPLIGRDLELAQLRQAFERVVEERTAYLFTVLGAAGIGKSRLVAELVSMVTDSATVVSGRCLSYGDGITFWPLAEIVRELTGNDPDPRAAIAVLVADDEAAERIAERIAATLGRDHGAVSPEETFWAVRRLFQALALRRPLVVVLEDIHWGEPTFLDLIDHLADWSRDAPIFLLCVARPELLEKRSGWGGGKLNATSLALKPLTETEANALIDHLAGDAGLPDADRRQITEAAEGNPLFVEQMLAMVVESGGRLEIPPTIQGLLAARLDRLSAEERAVIERASVIGKRFWESPLVYLSPEASRSTVGSQIEALMRKGLVVPDRPIVPGEEGYGFGHLLIRDAAYAGIPKTERADLHERFALWIEETAGERLMEVEEILGYHLEQAFRYVSELSPADERAGTLALKAGERLAAPGRRALARGDASAAMKLLGRAASLLPAVAPGRAQLLCDLGAALVLAGEFAEADAVLTEAIEASVGAEDRRLELHALLERAFLRALTDPERGVEELKLVTARAIPELEELGDDLGLAKAWRRIGDMHWMTNQWNELERALERARGHAERAGDAREAGAALMRLPMAIYYGPTPVPEAIERAEAILARAQKAPGVQSTCLVCLAGLQAMAGRFEHARSLLTRGRAISEELGFRVWQAGFSLLASDIAMLRDDPADGERELRRGYQALAGMGERGLLSMVVAELARAVYEQGRYDEAMQLTDESSRVAGTADVRSQITWRAIRGKTLARKHEFARAEACALEAMAIAEKTDDLNSQGRALMDLADVLELAGRGEEAAPVVERALVLFERKGNVVSTDKARERLAEGARAGAPAASTAS
jgi:class 3 adenylate cyclase/tetratricopeptide (TPR) repeat protein